MRLKIFLLLLGMLAVLPSGLSRAEPTSENNERLKKALARFPEADANKDGVLTMSEARDYVAKMRGGTKSKTGRKKKAQLAPQTVSGKNIPKGQEIKGYNGLYMGHSFFRPAAQHLLKVIPDTRVVDHTEYIVMKGGAGGSPGGLWGDESKRAAGQKYLDTKKVDLMVMTYYNEANSSVEDYAKWFDYALSRNPKITFMVAIPWGKELYKASQSQIDNAENGAREVFEKTVAKLRKKYPKNKILYCPYGLGVYELIRRLKKGKLPGVKYIVNPDGKRGGKNRTDQILTDPLGHGSDLVTYLNALVWLQTIYRYDLSTIKKKFRVEGLPDIDLNEIAVKIYKKVEPYNAVYD